jgi:putative DNA primase/helicase
MIHLVFTESYLGREDTTLGDRLRAELPGVLNWALDGLERLTARGRFVAPESSRTLDEDVVRSASPIAAFIDEVCALERGAETNLDVLYRAYREWCTQEGREHVATKDRFAKDLRSAFPKLGSERRGTGQGRYRAIVGLVLPASHFLQQ